MRVGHVLLVAIATVFALTCDVTSASTNSLRSVNDAPSPDLLETETHEQRRLVKKLPPSVINDLLKNDDQLISALTTWQQGKATEKGLAKSLGLSRSQFKWLRNFLNRHKIDESAILTMYRARLTE